MDHGNAEPTKSSTIVGWIFSTDEFLELHNSKATGGLTVGRCRVQSATVGSHRCLFSASGYLEMIVGADF